MSESVETTSRAVLEVIPIVMRCIRTEMRQHRSADLSVPQFRALLFCRRRPGASLSGLAAYQGLSLPSASKMVDVLVARGLILRLEDAQDRRRITLSLTAKGSELLDSAQEATQLRLQEYLRGLSASEREIVEEAMRLLREVFAPTEINEISARV